MSAPFLSEFCSLLRKINNACRWTPIMLIAWRELRSYFITPVGWAILATTQLIIAYIFLIYLDSFARIQATLVALPQPPGLTELVVAPLFNATATIALVITPLLTMRLISAERRDNTFSLLLSAPVSMTEIVLGKFLGCYSFLFLLFLLTTAMALSLLWGGILDMGVLIASALGLCLLIACFTAFGLFISSLTHHPTTAALVSLAVLLLLWILDVATKSGEGTGLFPYLSLLRHYQNLLQGILVSSDILYYVLFIMLFLSLSILRLHTQRICP